jgi:hypothetical protein
MKLLQTIEKLISEAENQYNNALDNSLDEKEIDRLEKNYKDSLKLLKTFYTVKNIKKK